jgi:anti-sigma factor RsiW
MDCAELLRTQSFIDGELDSAASADAERHIETCADCQAFVADAAASADLIRRHAVQYKAPETLRRKIQNDLKAPSPPKPANRSFWLGAGSGAGVGALLAAGFAVFALMPPTAATLGDALVDAHTKSLMDGATIQVASSSHHTVKPWFAGRIAISPPVADFPQGGFILTGGRLATVSNIPMAVVVYRHGAHEVDLYSWADNGQALPDMVVSHGYRVKFWKGRDLDFAAVSDMDAPEFDKFAALVKSAE